MNNGPTTIRRSISWIGTPWEEIEGSVECQVNLWRLALHCWPLALGYSVLRQMLLPLRVVSEPTRASRKCGSRKRLLWDSGKDLEHRHGIQLRVI